LDSALAERSGSTVFFSGAMRLNIARKTHDF
jgi:hypothetical protein